MSMRKRPGHFSAALVFPGDVFVCNAVGGVESRTESKSPSILAGSIVFSISSRHQLAGYAAENRFTGRLETVCTLPLALFVHSSSAHLYRRRWERQLFALDWKCSSARNATQHPGVDSVIMRRVLSCVASAVVHRGARAVVSLNGSLLTTHWRGTRLPRTCLLHA